MSKNFEYFIMSLHLGRGRYIDFYVDSIGISILVSLFGLVECKSDW